MKSSLKSVATSYFEKSYDEAIIAAGCVKVFDGVTTKEVANDSEDYRVKKQADGMVKMNP